MKLQKLVTYVNESVNKCSSLGGLFPPAFDLITERMKMADVPNMLRTRHRCVSRNHYSLIEVKQRLYDLHLVFHFASFIFGRFI